MLSKITIEVDFENGNMPVIQILQQDSDDVRDKLISQFLQSLGHTSRWGVIEYKHSIGGDGQDKHKWFIKPLTVRQLAEVEMPMMEAVIKDTLPIEKPEEGSAPAILHPGNGYIPQRFG